MNRDYTEHIAEFWPTIMRAWDEFSDKHPVIECDVVKRQVLAWSAEEYINGLSERTREATRQQYELATVGGGIMIFILDSKHRVRQSQVYMPDNTSVVKPKKSGKARRKPVRPRTAGGLV
jgi:hypothetical protein